MAKFPYSYNDESLENKNMLELLSIVEDLFNERDQYNSDKGMFERAHSRDNTEIKKYFEIFNKIKTCVEEKRFTDGMEQAIILKLHMNQYSIFSTLVGDSAISNLFGAMTRIITTRFFDTLELIENKLKLEGAFPTMSLIEEPCGK
jgi:hypothetical protein